MIELKILRADGSIYWTEWFNDGASAQAWLATEQTRPYWDAAYTYTIQDTTPPPQPGAAMAQLRVKRDILIAACDWTQLSDSPLSAESKAAWASYRQALRSLPDQPGIDPVNPTWPVAPGGTSA